MPVVETLQQTVADFNSIKEAMNYIGFSVNNDPTSTYGDKIKLLKTELDSLDELETQVDSLTRQNYEYYNQLKENDTDFNDIYDAIVSKGQTPVKEERGTYAQSIRDIEGGTSFEINNAYYLFYEGVRNDVMDQLLELCKNVTNWNRAFYLCPIPNGKTIVVDLTHITNNDYTYVFQEAYPENNNSEITLVVNSNGLFINAFKAINSAKKYGLVNLELHDNSNGGFTSLLDLFNQANNIKSIIMDADCSNVNNLRGVFYQFNYNNVTNALHDIDLSSWGIDWTKVNNALSMFDSSRYLTSIKLGNNAVLSNMIADSMFFRCYQLQKIELDIVDTQVVPNSSNFWGYCNLFRDCQNLDTINYNSDKWVIYNGIQRLFCMCYKLVNIPPIELHLTDMTGKNGAEWTYESCPATEIYIDVIYEDNTLFWCQRTFLNCSKLEYVRGNFDMSAISNNSNSIFQGCSSLKCIETSGSFGGRRTDVNLTLDLSASPVFEIENFLNNLAINESGRTHTIKLHSTVYNALTDSVKNLATSKNYALSA